MDFLEWLSGNYINLIVVAFCLFNWKRLFLQPITGGNGVVQMDELAKYALVVLLVYMVYTEAQSPEVRIFSDAQFGIIVAGVFSIAAIKPAMSTAKDVWGHTGGHRDSPEKPV